MKFLAAPRSILLLLLVLPSLASLPSQASAQAGDSPVMFRFYYSSWMSGKVEASPADPAGVLKDEARLNQNLKSELEAIFLGHVGLSFSRLKMHRDYLDTRGLTAGCAGISCFVDENAVHETFNLTLYGREVEHDKFNLFLGAGGGKADYDYSIDGARQVNDDLYKDMSVERTFAGVEYSFQRIGFRLEISRVRASKTFQGTEAVLEETFQYFTVFIPLN